MSEVAGEPVRERAYAKLNLVLHVGRPRADGLHPLCSLFASIDLADELELRPAERDSVDCREVEGPNLATAAVEGLRRRLAEAAGAPTALTDDAGAGELRLPPLAIAIRKRIPVAAGLGGGSADAAAVLRAANRIAGSPLDVPALRELAAALGSDVPSQVEPRHALVEGVGERVAPIGLPPLAAVLVPQARGLSATDVYAELDRHGEGRERLDPEALRRLAASPPATLAARVENDLQPAVLRLRPELAGTLDTLREAGALAAAVSGSGPTCFGLFERREPAERAAAAIPGALVAALRAP